MVIYWLKNVGYYESIHSVNPICFIVGEVDEYIKEENGKKYLTFASTVVLETYAEQWNKIKSLIKKISDKQGDYDEKYIKIRFNSDDKFRLNKMRKLHNLEIIVRSIFEEDNKYYLQCSLGECLHEL